MGYDTLHLEFPKMPAVDPPSTSTKYSKFNQPLSKIFKMLQRRNLVKPRKPKPLPNPIPPQIDLSRYCHYHQTPGHTTDECYTIERIVQDLIDSGKLKDLEENPNIKTSPLSKNQDVPHTENKSLFNYPISL